VLRVSTLSAWERAGDLVRLERVERADTGGTPEGPAVLLGHGAEPPALERRWGSRTFRTLDGDRLVVEREDRWGRSDRAPTLVQRLRDEWALERACRENLRASGRD